MNRKIDIPVEKFQINDYKATAIRMVFRKEDLILLYTYCVASSLSLFVGVIFLSDGVLIDNEYIERFDEVLEGLGIYPIIRTDKSDYLFRH
jgi:hypothetical protein